MAVAVDLEAPGVLEEVAHSVGHRGDLVLLHADRKRQQLLHNLALELQAWGVHHLLLLAFEKPFCAQLAPMGVNVTCAYSTYLHTGALAGEVARKRVPNRYVAWLQRMHYLRRLVQLGVSVLALDTDITVHTDVHAALHALRGFALVTTFDYKGGFANANIGFMYISSEACNPDGPVMRLFEDFERRIASALRQPLDDDRGQGRHLTQWLWDQNVFNKALLSAMARPFSGRDVFLPDGSDANWTAAHRKELRARRFWKGPDELEAPLQAALRPPWLVGVRPPWYPSQPKYLWYPLRSASSMRVERVLLAPSWLVSLENGLGHKQKHVMYGASPAVAVFVHYTCVHQSENARAWPMRIFGHWRVPGAAQHLTPVAPTPLLVLEGATPDAPMPPEKWANLPAMALLLGSAAALSGRRFVMPVLNCTGLGDRILPGGLPSRCFWHLHTGNGVRCVYRIAGCPQHRLATPSDLNTMMSNAGIRSSPTISVEVSRHADSTAGQRFPATSTLDALLRENRDAPVLHLRIKLPVAKETPAAAEAEANAMLRGVRAWTSAAYPLVRREMRAFEKECFELTRVLAGRSCTNICS